MAVSYNGLWKILIDKKLQRKDLIILKELKENEDFFEAGVLERVYLPLWAYYSYGKCYVNFINHIPNYTCTLKCKNCSASIPYLKQKNPDVEQMKREIDLFFSKVDFCYTYDCTGGRNLYCIRQIGGGFKLFIAILWRQNWKDCNIRNRLYIISYRDEVH